KVVSLGHHLRADQNVQRSGGKRAERLLVLALCAGGVAVEPRHARAREFCTQTLLEMLGAFSKKMQILRIALRTLLRHGSYRAAVVTLKAVALFVISHGDAAIRALHRCAATSAQDKPGIAAPVDENQRLRAVREAVFDAAAKRCRNGARAVRFAEIIAQVHDLDGGERPVFDAGRKGQKLVLSCARSLTTF